MSKKDVVLGEERNAGNSPGSCTKRGVMMMCFRGKWNKQGAGLGPGQIELQ